MALNTSIIPNSASDWDGYHCRNALTVGAAADYWRKRSGNDDEKQNEISITGFTSSWDPSYQKCIMTASSVTFLKGSNSYFNQPGWKLPNDIRRIARNSKPQETGLPDAGLREITATLDGCWRQGGVECKKRSALCEFCKASW